MPKSKTAVNRRQKREVSLGNLTVNYDSYGVYIDGVYVELSLKQFEVLRVMVDHADQILPYDTFAEALWHSTDKRRIRNLNVLVHRLRGKLAASYPFVIKTIRSRGYGLIRATTSGASVLPWGAHPGGKEQEGNTQHTGKKSEEAMDINTGDTAWVLTSTALVMLMTPGLALFYGGLVRSKNVLATIMQSFIMLGIISVQFALIGYSLAFGPDQGGLIGNFDWWGLKHVSMNEANALYAPTIPHQTYMIFQMMFAVITPALITGAFAERAKFSTFVVFMLLWATLVYDPVAHWVWGSGGWLGLVPEANGDVGLKALDFAGGTVVHINAGIAALVAAFVYGKRHGFGREPMEPHDITMVVIGAALLWFGWFGFNAGSAVAAGRPRVERLHRHASRDRDRRARLDGSQLDLPRQAQRRRRGRRRGCRPRRDYAGIRLRHARWARSRSAPAPARSATSPCVCAPRSASTTRSTSSACTASAVPGAPSPPVSSASRRSTRSRLTVCSRRAASTRSASSSSRSARRWVTRSSLRSFCSRSSTWSWVCA